MKGQLGSCSGFGVWPFPRAGGPPPRTLRRRGCVGSGGRDGLLGEVGGDLWSRQLCPIGGGRRGLGRLTRCRPWGLPPPAPPVLLFPPPAGLPSWGLPPPTGLALPAWLRRTAGRVAESGSGSGAFVLAFALASAFAALRLRLHLEHVRRGAASGSESSCATKCWKWTVTGGREGGDRKAT